MNKTLAVGNKKYKLTSEFIKLSFDVTDEMLNQLKMFPQLKSLNLGCTNLNDEGFKIVSSLSGLEQLNIQETEITDDGMQHLKNMLSLKDLRIKGNDQLTNNCIKHFKGMKSLKEIGIHETSIDQNGLKELLKYCDLKDVCLEVWQDNFQYSVLLELSQKYPKCEILAKGHGIFLSGMFEGRW